MSAPDNTQDFNIAVDMSVDLWEDTKRWLNELEQRLLQRLSPSLPQVLLDHVLAERAKWARCLEERREPQIVALRNYMLYDGARRFIEQTIPLVSIRQRPEFAARAYVQALPLLPMYVYYESVYASTEIDKTAATIVMTGWVRESISLKVNKRLARALRVEAAQLQQDHERLFRTLLPAVVTEAIHQQLPSGWNVQQLLGSVKGKLEDFSRSSAIQGVDRGQYQHTRLIVQRENIGARVGAGSRRMSQGGGQPCPALRSISPRRRPPRAR
ncbi:MAG: hypothetical protein M3Q65_04780 [Chloroflexota bacterium]|nr:hypothetical protein [Chloroflexota bacterium]